MGAGERPLHGPSEVPAPPTRDDATSRPRMDVQAAGARSFKAAQDRNLSIRD